MKKLKSKNLLLKRLQLENIFVTNKVIWNSVSPKISGNLQKKNHIIAVQKVKNNNISLIKELVIFSIYFSLIVVNINNIYFWHRFGLANAIDNYIGSKTLFV